MINPFTAAVSWLVARPAVSHAAVAAGETGALAVGLGALHIAHAPIVAALVVSTFYYGREAGQREHDLKHGATSHGAVRPAMAFVGAEYGILWGVDNLVQWLAAAGASAAVAAILTIAKALAA